MATSPPDQNSKCFFLELPAELRNMIYQHACLLHDLNSSQLYLNVKTRKISTHASTKPRIAWGLARTNRQIREEALPILYSEMTLIICALDSAADTGAADSWLKIAHSSVLAAIPKIFVMVGSDGQDCGCTIYFRLTDLARPVRFHECGPLFCCFYDMRDQIKKYERFEVTAQQEIVSKLEICGGKSHDEGGDERATATASEDGILGLVQEERGA